MDSARKSKRNKARLAALGVAAAVAAGAFAVIGVNSAYAAGTQQESGTEEVVTKYDKFGFPDQEAMEQEAIDALCHGRGGDTNGILQDIIFDSRSDKPGKTFVTIIANCRTP